MRAFVHVVVLAVVGALISACSPQSLGSGSVPGAPKGPSGAGAIGGGADLAPGQQEPWVALEHSTLSTCGITEGRELACLHDDADELPEGGDFVEVELSGGWPHMGCALRENGQAVCFAPAGASQDLVDEAPDVVFAQLAGRDFVVEGQVCGLDEAGAVHCWGDVKTAPPEDEVFVAIDGGGGDFCGLRPDGTVRCWEAFSGRRLVEPPPGTWEAVSVGDEYACVRAGTTVECWGRLPDDESPDGELLTVSAGEWSVCGIRPKGKAACWGSNGWGQSELPDGVFVSVRPARLSVAALRSNGSVSLWGGGP